MASGLGINSPPMRTIAFLSIQDWQFRSPVFIGDTIRVQTKLREKEIRARGRRGVITWERRIVNQADKVVQEGLSRTLVECRPTTGRGSTPAATGGDENPP
jgi:acyl dehydratase